MRRTRQYLVRAERIASVKFLSAQEKLCPATLIWSQRKQKIRSLICTFQRKTSTFCFCWRRIFCLLCFKEIKNGVVVDYDLEGLSTKLGKSWEALAKRLEFGEAEIEGFDHENKELKIKSYRMLCAWKRREASSATYEVLYKALHHEYVSRKDLAVKYCIRKSTDKEESISERWTWRYDKDYSKRQTWICTTWLSFPLIVTYCLLLLLKNK